MQPMLVGSLPPLEVPTFTTTEEENDWLRARLDQERMARQEADIWVRHFRAQLFGPRSERQRTEVHHPNQTSLFSVPVVTETGETSSAGDAEADDAIGTDADNADNADNADSAEGDASGDDKAAIADKRKAAAKNKQKNGGGRKPVNDRLEEREMIVEATPEQKVGPNGERRVLLGYEVSARTHIEPARLFRLLTKREIWGEPDTHCATAVAAVPPAIIPKGKLSDGAVCELMYGKYILGLPFYRQVADYNLRGAELNTSICSDAARRFAAFLDPIRQAILKEVLSAPFIHIDETIMREFAADHCRQRYLWAWHAGGNTYFHYGGRGIKEVAAVFGLGGGDPPAEDDLVNPGYHGFMMADGLAVYDSVAAANPDHIQRLLCMVHARRQFLPLVDILGHAKEIVGIFNGIMKVDREARKYCKKNRLRDQAAHDHVYQARQRDALPLLDHLQQRLTALRPCYHGIDKMANAIAYSLDRWADLTRYTTRGDLPIDNNAAERAIRPVVIGRKNYLFVGSEDAGDWCATNYTVLESARAQGLDPRWYMQQMTQALHTGRTDHHNLTPRALRQAYRDNRAAAD